MSDITIIYDVFVYHTTHNSSIECDFIKIFLTYLMLSSSLYINAYIYIEWWSLIVVWFTICAVNKKWVILVYVKVLRFRRWCWWPPLVYFGNHIFFWIRANTICEVDEILKRQQFHGSTSTRFNRVCFILSCPFSLINKMRNSNYERHYKDSVVWIW